MITQARVKVDWDWITQVRREKAIQANKREKTSYKAYEYQKGKQVLVKLEDSNREGKMNNPYGGPYKVIKTFKNGTIKINRGLYTENVHIHRVKPYKVLESTDDK